MEENLYRKAVFTMDVEDWYHLEYVKDILDLKNDKNPSTKDGIEKYVNILSKHNIKANFFVVGNYARYIKNEIRLVKESNHEIGLHSHDHKRPITLSKEDFLKDLKKNIDALKSMNINPVGYRAPCFALGNNHLNTLISDFKHLLFDSSYINQKEHPLYTPIDLSLLHFSEIQKGVFQKSGFFEFEVSTVKFFNLNIPISGGGYIRILPWFLYKFLLKRYLNTGKYYTFYIHPFEISKQDISLPKQVSLINKFRFSYNRKKTCHRVEKTIQLLKEYGYSFHTFSELSV